MRPGTGCLETLGWHWGVETCPEPLCSLLQGLPTEEDFSEVLTQVHEVESPSAAWEGVCSAPLLSFPICAVGMTACPGALQEGCAYPDPPAPEPTAHT